MHKRNKNKILIIAAIVSLLLIALITRRVYKSSFAVDTDLSKLDSETGAIISVDEKLFKIANKYDLEGLNKLKAAIDALEDKEEYEKLYAEVKQAIFEAENSDNEKSVEVDKKIDTTDTAELAAKDTTSEDEDTTKDTAEDVDKEADDKKDDSKSDTTDTTDTTKDAEEPKDTKAGDVKAPVIAAKEVDRREYIYMDLAAGTIKYNGSTYSGFIYETVNGTTTRKEVSGNHSGNNKYYIYQSSASNQAGTGLVTTDVARERMYIPIYDRIVGSGNVGNTSVAKTSINNNNSVENVINSWRTSVSATDRTATSNYIEISGYGSNLNYNITIDNVWSTNLSTSNTVNTGGLLVNGVNNNSSKSTLTNTKFNINFEGDNRFGQIFYSALKSDNDVLSFSSQNDGSIVVAEFSPTNRNNHFRSIIGGQDGNSAENTYGLVFNSGNIYAGALEADNCSAIGGGGNGVGGITINGGNVTAVCATSGAAIGGGIGWVSKGGDAYVTINDGNVYAYNYSGREGSNRVAGVAIGGGSGFSSPGNNNTEVTINGGAVYAESTGGVAIGGGNSTQSSAGNAKIYINGGKVTAKSVGDPNKGLEASSGIGGGTGYTRGGNATVLVKAGTVDTGDIGGGYSTHNGPIGSADISVDGGTTTGRFILNQGTFKLTNGVINGNATDNGGAVQINNGTATISGGTIQNGNATNGGAIYMGDGTLEISGGNIQNNKSTQYGGAINIVGGTINITGGDIHSNIATIDGGGAYLGGGTLNITGGSLNNNSAKNGGGIYLGSGDLKLSNGKVESNSSTNGAGIYVSNGNITIEGGEVYSNKATANGGAIYLGGGSYNMSNGSIKENKAVDGAGIYLIGTTINLTGGQVNQNNASNNGGGFYIGDNSSAYLSNGTINANIAKNGGGFYQTQSSNSSIVQLQGSCELYNNKAQEGNGGAIYIAGGSTFKALGGKVAYNEATSTSVPAGTLAKNSNAGVGGGIYIKNGTFSMNDGDVSGNAAIFGNTASYAADDLFASGTSTSFDTIKVTQMQLDDEYIGSDSWFEDYPENESHLSLVQGNQTTIVSKGRYKVVSDDDAVAATTVLERNCTDYICITMGKSNGTLEIVINDSDVQSDQVFLFRVASDDGVIRLYEDVSLEKSCKICTLPSGDYTLTIIPSWSWRYSDKYNAKIVEDGSEREENNETTMSFKILSEQTTTIKTSYSLKNNNNWATFLWDRIFNIGG